MKHRTVWVVYLALAFVSWTVAADTRTLVILHTNDIHDHVRPGYNGSGGFPYVAGYIKSVTAERKDVLVLDAGDVMEKGDMVAFKTEGILLYELMGEVGYQAVTVGNHDLKRGFDHLYACEKAGQPMAMVCANLLHRDGSPYFMPSKIFDIGGVKVGVVGLTRPKDGEGSITLKETGTIAAQEATRLAGDCDLLVALCHMGTDQCAQVAKRAPAIQVFIGGHTHAALQKPDIVKETGAMIVQAGMYGQYVGRIELTIDLEKKAIVKSDARLVPMKHDQVPCDATVLAKVQQREKELCPEAVQVVGRCEKALTNDSMGRLAAAAFRQRAGTDIGLCLTSDVIRNGVPAGSVDVNALFVAGGQLGNEIVTITLKGVDLADYMSYAYEASDGVPQGDGFRMSVRHSADKNDRGIQTDLDPDQQYRVALTRTEYDKRMKKFFAKRIQAPLPDVKACDFSFTDALAGYAESLQKDGISLDSRARELAAGSALNAAPRAGKHGKRMPSDSALRRAAHCLASVPARNAVVGRLEFEPGA